MLFRSGVTDAEYDSSTNTINFRILFTLQANCSRVSRPGVDTNLSDGVECDGSGVPAASNRPLRTDDEVHYQITVYFAIIVGTPHDFRVTLASYEKVYTWNNYVLEGIPVGAAIVLGATLPVGVATGPRGRTFVLKQEIFLQDRKSTRLNSSHIQKSRMPSSA